MKKFFSFALAICIFTLVFAGCGADSNSASNFSIDEYRNSISESSTAIYDAAIYLANVGEYEYNYCSSLEQLGSSGDPNQEAVDGAFEWLAEKSDATRESVDAAYESIRQQYKEIILVEPNGNEAKKLYEHYSDMYEAYADLYALVTDPSCSLSDFVEKYNDYISTIKECNEDLSTFLG